MTVVLVGVIHIANSCHLLLLFNLHAASIVIDSRADFIDEFILKPMFSILAGT
jgi:hypothetical protein